MCVGKIVKKNFDVNIAIQSQPFCSVFIGTRMMLEFFSPAQIFCFSLMFQYTKSGFMAFAVVVCMYNALVVVLWGLALSRDTVVFLQC